MGPDFEGWFIMVLYWVYKESEIGAHIRRPCKLF